MSRRRKRQCFPIFEAGNSPTRASLYTVDLGTRRKWATSMTVKISPSVDDAPFDCDIVDADTALFIMNGISVLPVENLSRRERSSIRCSKFRVRSCVNLELRTSNRRPSCVAIYGVQTITNRQENARMVPMKILSSLSGHIQLSNHLIPFSPLPPYPATPIPYPWLPRRRPRNRSACV